MQSSWKKQAHEIRASKDFEATVEFLNGQLKLRPNDGAVYYQLAWTHDALGKEMDAVACYRRALELGLEEEEAQGASIGLGSTLRALGRYDESLLVFDEAVAKFPLLRSLSVFRAMTLFNLGVTEEAFGTLLKTLAETSGDSSIAAYRGALTFYSDKLSQTFE